MPAPVAVANAPIEPIAVRAPEPLLPAPEPVAAVTPAPPPVESDDLAKLPPKPKAAPRPPPAEAEAANKTTLMIVPKDIECTGDDDWRRDEKAFADRVENTYYEVVQKAGSVPDHDALDQFSKLKGLILVADDTRKCARAHHQLVEWARKYNR